MICLFYSKCLKWTHIFRRVSPQEFARLLPLLQSGRSSRLHITKPISKCFFSTAAGRRSLRVRCQDSLRVRRRDSLRARHLNCIRTRARRGRERRWTWLFRISSCQQIPLHHKWRRWLNNWSRNSVVYRTIKIPRENLNISWNSDESRSVFYCSFTFILFYLLILTKLILIVHITMVFNLEFNIYVILAKCNR